MKTQEAIIKPAMKKLPLEKRIIYETCKPPKRKDHIKRQMQLCENIDKICQGNIFFYFRKYELKGGGYLVRCEIENYNNTHQKRIFASRKTSCIESLRQIYTDIRDAL